MKEIQVYDFIGAAFGYEGLSPLAFRQEVFAAGRQDILVSIHSEGGNAFDALNMVDALNAAPGHVTTRNEGLAASAAGMLFMAGDTREVAPNSFTMIHEPVTETVGDVSRHRANVQRLEAMRAKMVRLMTRDTTLSEAEALAMIEGGDTRETWLDAGEMVAAGLAHGLAEDIPAIAASLRAPNLDLLGQVAAAIPERVAARGARPAGKSLADELAELLAWFKDDNHAG